MRTKLGIGGVIVLTAALWRAASELIERMRHLDARGDLGPRLARRRVELVDRALLLAGVSAPARELALVPVQAGAARPAGASVASRSVPIPSMPSLSTHASVQVGLVRGGPGDVDDVGLLEGAMRRAASDRMDVSATGVRRKAMRRARRAVDHGDLHVAAEVLAAAPEPAPGVAAAVAAASPRPARQAVPRAPRPARLAPSLAPVEAPILVPRPPRRDGGWTDWRWLAGEPEVELDAGRSAAGERTWPLPTALAGVLLTLVPLVRPLSDGSPWLAVAGIALVIAAWAGSRRD